MIKSNNLELYIHIPFCVKKCNYCDFISAPATDEVIQQYVDALCNEIKMMSSDKNWTSAFIGEKEESADTFAVSSIYIGGGTPSLLSIRQMSQLVNALKKNFQLPSLRAKKKEKPKVEFTVECNPGTVDKAKLKAYKKLGINRISFGLQSTDAEELKFLGRIHTFKDFLDSYSAAREVGFDNINVDLMQAVPGQTLNSWKRSLAMVSVLLPEHISAYSLIIEEGTAFSQGFKEGENCDYIELGKGMKGTIPSETEEREIYYYTKEYLEKAGYKRYEISNFSRPGFECKHNVGYWKRENYLGLGLNSSSMVNNVRWKNTENLSEYIAFLGNKEKLEILQSCDRDEKFTRMSVVIKDAEKLSVKSQMEEFMFLGLRNTDGINKNHFFEEFGQDFDYTYGDVVYKLKEKELIEDKDGWIRLTDKGVDVSNVVLAEFLFE